MQKLLHLSSSHFYLLLYLKVTLLSLVAYVFFLRASLTAMEWVSSPHSAFDLLAPFLYFFPFLGVTQIGALGMVCWCY